MLLAFKKHLLQIVPKESSGNYLSTPNRSMAHLSTELTCNTIGPEIAEGSVWSWLPVERTVECSAQISRSRPLRRRHLETRESAVTSFVALDLSGIGVAGLSGLAWLLPPVVHDSGGVLPPGPGRRQRIVDREQTTPRGRTCRQVGRYVDAGL